MHGVKLIVGLGNPGKKYEHTRHNAGFLVVDALLEASRKNGKAFEKRKGSYQVAILSDCLEKVFIAKPTAFMNVSGQSVKDLIVDYNISPSQILIVVDDIYFPLGKIRIRSRGTSGGHNGIQSVIDCLGTSSFARLRVGIGLPNDRPKDLAGYVLSEFHGTEYKDFIASIERARDACLDWVYHGLHKVMGKYN